MVYHPKNIRSNFQIGEMPVENIIGYSRSGGCFISVIQGTLFVAFLFSLTVLLCSFTYYSTKHKQEPISTQTLENFINDEKFPEKIPNANIAHHITPKHYIVGIQTRLNETDDPFTYNGVLYAIVEPNIDFVQSIELLSNNLRSISADSFVVYRMSETSETTFTQTEGSYAAVDPTPSTPIVENVTETNEDSEDILVTDIATVFENSTESEQPTIGAMHSGPKTIREIFSDLFPNIENNHSELLIKNVGVDKKRGKIRINLGLSLRIGSSYVLKVNFFGNVTSMGEGLIYTRYFDEHGNESYFAASLTTSNVAKTLFPTISYDCNHQIAFDTYLLRRPHMTSVTNSKLSKKINYQMGSDVSEWILDVFERTPPMRVSDFGFVITQITPTIIEIDNKLTVYAYIQQKVLPTISITDDLFKKIFNEFANITGEYYFANRINVVGIPSTFETAYDISTALIIASEHYFVDDAEHELQKIQQISEVVLFLSKIWVQPFSQNQNEDDYWINAALSMYLHRMSLNVLNQNTSQLSENYALDNFNALANDIDLNSIKKNAKDFSLVPFLANKVDKYSKHRIKELFLLNTFKQIIGAHNFTEAIRMHCALRKRNEESNLLQHIQKSIFEQSIDQNVAQISSSWLNSNLYALLQVQIDVDNDELIMGQEEFIIKPNAVARNLFSIPIDLVTENMETFAILSSETTVFQASSVAGNNAWILINSNAQGYYRVNYDSVNWKSIIAAVKENRELFDSITRATLADDAFNLARYEYLNYSMVFELINCWKNNETEFLPWHVVLTHLDFIHRHTSDLFVYRFIKDYTINLIKPTYDALDDFKPTSLKTLIRTWACNLDIADCSHSIDNFFNRTMFGNSKSITCTAIKYGDPYSYRKIRLFPASDAYIVTQHLLKALSCSRNLDFLKELFDLIYDDSFKPFMADIVRACAQNKIGKRMLLEILFEDFPRVVSRTGIEILMIVFEEISTEFEYKMLEDIFAKHSNHFSDEYRSTFKYITNKIKNTFYWRKIISYDLERIDWALFIV